MPLPIAFDCHLALLSEGLHRISVINVIMPRPKMVQAGTDAGRIARIVRMRTGSDGQLGKVLLDELGEPLTNKDVALSAQMQTIVQVFGPWLVRARCGILHILPQVEMRNIELVGNLGGCLRVLARELECPFQLTRCIVSISLDLVLETSLMMDGRRADDDDLDVMANVLRDGAGNLLEIVLETLQWDVMPRIQHGVGCIVGTEEYGCNSHIHGIVIATENILLSFGSIEIVQIPIGVVA